MGFLAALASLAGPITARVFIALGFSVVTIAGVDLAVGNLKTMIVSSMSGGPAAALQLAGLAGCWEGLGIVFGAVSFAVSMWSITSARRVLGVA